MKILLAIHPKYVEQIFNGTKHYEYRTKLPKLEVSTIVVYETYPTMKIVGEFSVDEILKKDIVDLWDETNNYSGIDKDSFFEYYKGRKQAYAYKVGKITKYKRPRSLEEFGLKSAPQSFVYLCR